MVESDRNSWFGRNPKKTLLLIVMFLSIFIVFLAELGLRHTYLRNLVRNNLGFPKGMYKSDSMLGYDLVRNYKHGIHRFSDDEYRVYTNNIGCFDDEVKIGAINKYILLLGDSFTWGYTSFDKKWGTILEKKEEIRVMKCGVSGYGLRQEITKGERVVKELEKKPKLILVGYFQNDLNDDYFLPDTVIDGYLISRIKSVNYNTGKVSYYSHEQMLARYHRYMEFGSPDLTRGEWLKRMAYFAKKKSIIANMLVRYMHSRNINSGTLPSHSNSRYQVYISMLNEDKYPWVRAVWREQEKELIALKEWAKKMNAKLAIVIIPTKEQVYGFLGGPYSNAESIRREKDMFNNLGINYLDLYPIMKRSADLTARSHLDSAKDFYWEINDHWSETGNVFVGNVVSTYVKNILSHD